MDKVEHTVAYSSKWAKSCCSDYGDDGDSRETEDNIIVFDSLGQPAKLPEEVEVEDGMKT